MAKIGSFRAISFDRLEKKRTSEVYLIDEEGGYIGGWKRKKWFNVDCWLLNKKSR